MSQHFIEMVAIDVQDFIVICNRAIDKIESDRLKLKEKEISALSELWNISKEKATLLYENTSFQIKGSIINTYNYDLETSILNYLQKAIDLLDEKSDHNFLLPKNDYNKIKAY